MRKWERLTLGDTQELKRLQLGNSREFRSGFADGVEVIYERFDGLSDT